MKSTPKNSGELIYGAHSIIEILKAKKRNLISIYTTKPLPKSWDRIRPHITGKTPQIQYVTKDILDNMVNTTDHNGIVAWVSPFKYQTKLFNPTEKKFILMLDGVQDVRNLGAILRSAYCTGTQGVVLCKKGSALLNAAALKASAGLAEHLDVYIAASALSAAQELKNAGYNIYLAVMDGKKVQDVEFKAPLCLVIGNEASGISPNILGMGQKITIPQKQADISYNASVAAGILLFLTSTKTNFIK